MNEAITFNEEKHEYIRGDVKYISVTTLIERYEKPFDSEYWSTYKAVKDVLERYGEWSQYKWGAGGWESVVEFYKTYSHPRSQEITIRRLWYLTEWDRTGKTARDRGTVIHNALEKKTNEALFVKDEEHGDILIPSHSTPLDPLNAAGENLVMSEVRIYNDRYQVAGTVDRVDKKNMVVNLRDHKTSKEITKVAFRDEKMLPPVEHLPQANYYGYSIQLSLYAWMLAQFGYSIGTLNIDHRSRKDGSLLGAYPVTYLKKEVESILLHYDKSKRR